ncbi:MAG: YhbY family RNA-binding protein [Nanoarchaeota archaeon]
MASQMKIQLGKKGLTEKFLEEIKKRFQDKKIKNIKVDVLRSARETKEDIKRYAEEIKNFLGEKFSYRILGFSIFLMKWRKVR